MTRAIDSWSEAGNAHIAIVDGRLAAVVYWNPPDRSWYWVPADRPSEHFHVVHGGTDRKDRMVLFHVEEILRAYFAGTDPVEASGKRWPPEDSLSR